MTTVDFNGKKKNPPSWQEEIIYSYTSILSEVQHVLVEIKPQVRYYENTQDPKHFIFKRCTTET